MVTFHYAGDVARFNLWIGNGRVDVEFPTAYKYRPRLAWLMAEIAAALALEPQQVYWWFESGERVTMALPRMYVSRPFLRYRLS